MTNAGLSETLTPASSTKSDHYSYYPFNHFIRLHVSTSLDPNSHTTTTMDFVWSDADLSMATPSSFSFSSSAPPSPPPSFLTTYQNSLISAYVSHTNRVNDLMNAVVDLDISVQRERDEPSVQYLKEELEKTQEELVLHRDARRRKEREINKEEKNLKAAVGKGSTMAKRQLDEIETYMGSENAVICLR